MCAGKVNTSLPHFFLTSAQIRAARSLIRWTAEDLAAASALSVATIRRAELKENQTALTSANDLAIRRALESAGVEFIDENGCRESVFGLNYNNSLSLWNFDEY